MRVWGQQRGEEGKCQWENRWSATYYSQGQAQGKAQLMSNSISPQYTRGADAIVGRSGRQ
jgi:hypothetical protein